MAGRIHSDRCSPLQRHRGRSLHRGPAEPTANNVYNLPAQPHEKRSAVPEELTFRYTSLTDFNLPSNASLEGCLALLSVDGSGEVDYDWRLVLRSDADYEFWLSQCGQYGRAGNLGCGYYPALNADEQ